MEEVDFFLRLRLLGSLFFISRVGLLLSLSLRVSTGGSAGWRSEGCSAPQHSNLHSRAHTKSGVQNAGQFVAVASTAA